MALASVVRNGAEGGMVKSRGRADEGSGTFALEQGLGFRQRVRRADMHPAPVEPHAVELALGERAVPQQVQREATLRRVLEQSLVAQRHAGKGERHNLVLAAPRQPPSASMAKSPLAA